MSERALAWAREQLTANHETQIVLYVVANAADEEGLAFSPLEAIATASRMSLERTAACLAELAEHGLVVLGPGDEMRLQFECSVNVPSPAETETE